MNPVIWIQIILVAALTLGGYQVGRALERGKWTEKENERQKDLFRKLEIQGANVAAVDKRDQQRQVAINNQLRSARDELEQLRVELATPASAPASCARITEHAGTAEGLFGGCAAEYLKVAEDAARLQAKVIGNDELKDQDHGKPQP